MEPMKRLSAVVMLVCVIGIVGVLASFPPRAFSATPTATLEGYAWSSNIGWICFYDTATPSNCTGATVNVNSNDSLSGYAWSANAGWISFNSSDTASCGSAATYNPSTGALTGWAKALDGVDSDGCISLSGTAQNSSPYGVTFSGGDASGYAWGSDVFGWIRFWGSDCGVTLTPLACANGLNYATYGPSCTCPSGQTQSGSTCVPLCQNGQGIQGSCASCNSGYLLTGGSCLQELGPFSANPVRVLKGETTALTWTTNGMVSCGVVGTDGSTPLASGSAVSNGQHTVTATVTEDTIYTLTCTDTLTATHKANRRLRGSCRAIRRFEIRLEMVRPRDAIAKAEARQLLRWIGKAPRT